MYRYFKKLIVFVREIYEGFVMKYSVRIMVIFLLSLLILAGCEENSKTSMVQSSEQGTNQESDSEGDVASSEESVIVMHKLYFDVNVTSSEDVFQNHSIELYLDEQPFHKFEDGKYYTELAEVEEGNHVISFKVDDAILNDLNQNVNVNADMSIVFTLGFNDSLDITSFGTSESIADSAIVYDSMENVALDKAIEDLANKHFVNVRYESNDSTSILDTSEWLVVGQNVSPGSQLDKAEEIVLTCRKVYFQLYFDLSFDQNIFLATYDIEVYLDGEKIDTIPHGKNFTYSTKLKEGEHTATFYKSTDNKVFSEKKINITTDSTLSGRLHSNNKDIELNNFVLNNGIADTSFEVVNVVGMQLDKALSVLGGIGFTNVVKEPSDDIWMDSNWIVTAQSVSAGTKVDKNTKIVLNSVKKEAYLSSNYVSLNMIDAAKKAKALNNEILYVDYAKNMYMTNMISTMDENEKKLWIVKQASFNSEGKIQLDFIYTGMVEMPNLMANNLADALATLKNAEFSDVESKTQDGSYIWDNSDWKVVSQSVSAGTKVNANKKIVITVGKNDAVQATTQTSSPPLKEETQDSSDASAEKEAKAEENSVDSSSTEPESVTEIKKAEVVLPDRSSKLGRDYDSKGDSTVYYINVDGISNKPKLKNRGKATVTDGVAEYLDSLKEQNFKVEIVSTDKQTPHSGFTIYDSSFKVSNSEISWTMDLSIESEKYVEYELDIHLP